MPRDEVEAAYFTLLRARDEVDGAARATARCSTTSSGVCTGSAPRAPRSSADVSTGGCCVPSGTPTARSTRPSTPGCAVIADERARLPERLASAEAFVVEAEADHDRSCGPPAPRRPEVYRDDPLDDEAELIAIAGDDAVATLHAGRDELSRDPLEVALDVLRVLQGWVDDEAAGRWLTSPQRRLEGRTPVEALRDGAFEEVEDAARAWVAANA